MGLLLPGLGRDRGRAPGHSLVPGDPPRGRTNIPDPVLPLRNVAAERLALSSFHTQVESGAACWRKTRSYSFQPDPPCRIDSHRISLAYVRRLRVACLVHELLRRLRSSKPDQGGAHLPQLRPYRCWELNGQLDMCVSMCVGVAAGRLLPALLAAG